MLDATPTPPPLIIVEEVGSHQPALFLGFMAVGSEDAMTKLEKRASELRFPSSRPKNDKGETEVMIVFPPNSDHRAGLQLYRDALSGKFGSFALEVVIITHAKASDGIDFKEDPSVEPTTSIVIPSS